MLKNVKPGQTVSVLALLVEGALRRRLIDMGITKNAKITVDRVASFGDPIVINVRGCDLTLRKKEASMIMVSTE